jgi:hypothetical protein
MMAACSSCGASLTPGSERCDLCGTAVAGVPEDSVERAPVEIPTVRETAPVATVPDPARDAVAGSTAPGPSFCIACGHANVPEARYCNRCGAELPSRVEGAPAVTATRTSAGEDVEQLLLPPEREDAHDRPSSEPGKRALWLVGSGVLVVVALYAMTNLGRRDAAPATPAAADPASAAPNQAAMPEADEPEIDPESVAALPLPDSLQGDATAAAALVAGAETANTAAAWDDAGRLYLDLTRRATPDMRPALARQAIASFRRSLAVADNPDVRTRMVSAYRYDPATTMQPVLELQRVLADQPNHAEANFQMGELRLQIGRADSAAASFARAAAHLSLDTRARPYRDALSSDLRDGFPAGPH